MQFDMGSRRISMHRVLLVAMGIRHALQLSAMVARLVTVFMTAHAKGCSSEPISFFKRRAAAVVRIAMSNSPSRASVPGPEHRQTLFQRLPGRALLKIWTIFPAYVSLNFQDKGLLVPDLQYLGSAIRHGSI